MARTKLLARIGRMFPRNTAVEEVKTNVHMDASPETVWRGMLFYEEVPFRTMPLLRMFLPAPISTAGDKTRVGELISCKYDGGTLEKRITVADPAHFVAFDVLVQDLGIEECISMTGGSYHIRAETGGADVLLTTAYCGHLRPRWLWRPLEHYLAHRMHRHILDGMLALLAASARESVVTAAPFDRKPSASPPRVANGAALGAPPP
jgi:hypothetical protein